MNLHFYSISLHNETRQEQEVLAHVHRMCQDFTYFILLCGEEMYHNTAM